MAKEERSVDELKIIARLLQNLLAIELWRAGLTQAEIGERLGVAAGSVNKMLKRVNKQVPTITLGEE